MKFQICSFLVYTGKATMINSKFYKLITNNILKQAMRQPDVIKLINEHFQKRQKQYRQGPAQRRSCNDICCLITFILLMGAFIGIGIYYLVISKDIFTQFWYNQIQLSQPLTVIKQLFVKYWPVIVGAFVLSIVLALIYICLLRACTKCMVYTMIVIAILAFLGLIGISIVEKAWGTVAAAGVGLLIFLCFLFCFRSSISRGIILLKATMQFIKQRPNIYLIPIFIIFLSILFLAFWLITLFCMQQQSSIFQQTGQPITKQVIFFIFWIFMIVFFVIFMYYVMVFMIGYMCANWYYGKNYRQGGCCQGNRVMNRASIGSITFITLIIGIVKILRYMVVGQYQSTSANGNYLAACCLCCLACCCLQIQYLISILNHNSVLAMAFTGEGFMSSAKMALSIIFRDFPLFAASSYLEQLLKFSALLLTAGIPTIIAYLVVYLVYNRDGSTDSYSITILILLIFLLCAFISIFLISVISIAMSAVFFYFCLGRRYRDMGVTILGTAKIIENLDDDRNFGKYDGNYDAVPPKSSDRIP